MRAAAIGKAATGVEAALKEFFREKVVGFFFAAGLEPDAVVLALLVILSADGIPLLDGQLLRGEFEILDKDQVHIAVGHCTLTENTQCQKYSD